MQFEQIYARIKRVYAHILSIPDQKLRIQLLSELLNLLKSVDQPKVDQDNNDEEF